MNIVTGKAQDQYWKRVGYRDSADAVMQAFALPKLEFIRQYVELADARLLDVGCGNGAFTRLFAQVCRYVVGVDYSEHILLSNPGGALLRGRAEELPFRDGAFDVVFVANLLHHSADPSAVVREASRVARQHVVLLEPNRLNPLMFLFSVVVREERGGLRSSRRFLTHVLQDHGCRVIRCAAMGMISQNKTPELLVPFLKRFDREIAWGKYLVAIGEKR